MDRDVLIQSKRLEALIGTWRTRGEVLGDDGETPVAMVDGYDRYEWLGPSFVIHRIDVTMGDQEVRGLEMIGPYLPDDDAFATRAYDNEGGEQVATATVDEDGAWTFRADGAKATLTFAADRLSASAKWVRSEDGETWRPWMRLRLNRE